MENRMLLPGPASRSPPMSEDDLTCARRRHCNIATFSTFRSILDGCQPWPLACSWHMRKLWRVEMRVYCLVSLLVLAGLAYAGALAVWLSSLDPRGEPLQLQRNVHSWRSRAIYHLLTDRFAVNGDVNGTHLQCGVLYDYCDIGGMGFSAILISPVVENAPYGYHGYWPRNFHAINPHFGSADDLKALVVAAHRAGLHVMVDVVANHVGCPTGGGPCGQWSPGSPAPWAPVLPFNQASDYHPPCTVDFQLYEPHNWQQCWLAGLPDLNQSQPRVREALKAWIKGLVREYSFDGVRLDASHLMDPVFVRELRDAAGVFGLAEFIVEVPEDSLRMALTAQLQDHATGAFLQSMLLAVDAAFLHGGPMLRLADRVEALHAAARDPDLDGLYLDNHDLERFYGRAKDSSLLANALVLILLSRGIPSVYYGSEQGYQGQHDPANRESLWPFFDRSAPIYKLIRTVLVFRQTVAIYKWAEQITRQADLHSYAFSRGPTLVIVTNIGSRQPSRQLWRIHNHRFSRGTTLCNILAEGDCLVVPHTGTIDITLINGEPKIYHPLAGM